jgi:hypothetical protein
MFEPYFVFRQMETELIDKLDILINENKGTVGLRFLLP